jgi:membrane protease YdiL (CAAX protease family)
VPSPSSSVFTALNPPKLALLLSAALLAQIGYWYLGSPGPTLLNGTPRSLEAALVNIGWALTLLLALPLLLLTLTGEAKRVPYGLGNWQLGLPLTLGLSVAGVFLIYLGSSDSALQATYPWAGRWPGQSVFTFLGWAGLYALYYVAFEFFYRGFLIAVLEPHWGLAGAVWTQVLMSTLIHLGKPLSETLAAFPAGFLFAFLALKTRSLVWPILLHLSIGLATDAFSLWRQGWLF